MPKSADCNTAAQPNQSPVSERAIATASGDQYLTFRLGQEQYAIDILRVQEIRNISLVTPIPNAPRHVEGIVNLRGSVVPIINLRSRLRMNEAPNDSRKVVVVVCVNSCVSGLVVDSVSDVITILDSERVDPPELGNAQEQQFIMGLANLGDEFTLLLDLEHVIDHLPDMKK